MNRSVLWAGLVVAVPLVALLIAGLGRDPHQVRSPLIGRSAPPFALSPAGGGAPVSLVSLRGTPVVLNFWATWCLPCLQEHPVLIAAGRAFGSRVRFLGIVYDDDEQTVLRFLQERGSAFPSLLDDGGKAAIAYGVFGVPETYFIDAQGKIVDKFVGPLDQETLQDRLRRAGLQP